MGSNEGAAALAAVRGDESAFAELVEPHRRELQVHCYRMLGSFEDSEDLVQETFLRAWRKRETFQGRSSFRAWLYRIATNACLDALERRPRVASLHDGAQPLAEIPWLQPYPDELLEGIATSDAEPEAEVVAKETIELAFIAAIQQLPPRPRAVLLLRDVLGWSAKETASLLEASVASVNSALQRARASLESREVHDAVQVDELDDDHKALLGRYVDAFERYDMESLTSVLHEDATWNMPPYDLWLQTHEDIVKWCLGQGIGCKGSRLVPTVANGMPAFGQYKPSPNGGLEPWSLQVIEMSDGQITGITFFLDTARMFPLFGLPEHLDA